MPHRPAGKLLICRSNVNVSGNSDLKMSWSWVARWEGVHSGTLPASRSFDIGQMRGLLYS